MKQVLLLLLCFITFSLSAQLVFEEEVHKVDFAAEGVYDLQNDIALTNSGTLNEEFIWDVETVFAPEEWNFYVCDFNKCYGPGTASIGVEASNLILTQETRDILFHLQPASTQGEGKYILNLRLKDSPEDIAVSITLHFNGTLVDTKDEQINKLSIYPNPVSDYFQLENPENIASQVVLYDLLGKQVKSFDTRMTSDFYIGDISEGRYFARIFDANGQALKVLKIVKRYNRP